MTGPPPFDVAIVGGGASGTLLAIQLLRRAPKGWRLLLLDRAGDFARGVAYRTPDTRHLLNVPAARMSALPEEEGHFLDWLQHAGAPAGPDTYAPRRQYGDYLVELLAQTEAGAKGTLLERRQAEVVALEDSPAGVLLALASGRTETARQVVLALGNPEPARLPASGPAAARVWQSPWPRDAAWPAQRASVLLVGAGLTAMDWVVALAARGHRGPLHLLSRHGLLPSAQPLAAAAPLTPTRLPHGRLRPLVRALRTAVASAGGDWRPVVDGLRPVAQKLWEALGETERRRFNRHVRTRWEVLRHRLAPVVAATAEALRATGQLQLHAGRLRAITRRGSRLEARFRPRGEAGTARLLVDLAINCTGPAGHATAPDGLVSCLLRTGRAAPGPLGLGLGSSPTGALLDAQGHAGGRVWTLGPVRRGNHWESTAVPDIRLQAAALAGQLLRGA